MSLPTIIRDRTNDGISIVDFLFAVMRNELTGFKPCHRLDAAKLLVKYERDEALNFNLDYIPEPSRRSSGSSEDTYFDEKLAKVIRESTDDGRSVCRFLINVMEGELKQFKPHHRISAARELLSRGFGKHARQAVAAHALPQHAPSPLTGEGWGEGENHEHQTTPSRSSQPDQSPSPPLHGPDCCEEETDWDKINEIIDAGKERSDRILAEQGIDPDNPPYPSDFSVFDEAADNSHKWFEEWKNSIDPEEYHAVINDTADRFSKKLDLRIERRKQIIEDSEQREKEEAERQAEQAKARVEAKAKAEAEEKEEEELGPPPSEEDHERWSPTPSIPTSFRLVNCGHPECKLHDGPVYYPEDDRSSPYYWNGQQPSWFGTNPI